MIRIGDEKCVQNFGEETSWKISTWKSEEKMVSYIIVDLSIIDCEIGMCMTETQDFVSPGGWWL